MRKAQAGLGLVELLTTIGLLGGVLLLISSLNQSANKVATNLEVNTDLLETLQEVQVLLSKADNCKVTFQGKNAVNFSNVVQTIKQKNNSGYADVYPTVTSNPQKVYGSKRLKINSYSLSDAAPNVSVTGQGTTHLMIQFNRGKNGTQTEFITKTIPLSVKVDGSGNITDCAASIGSKNDLWKYAANNTDIYYLNGVGVGTNTPSANLTVMARTFPDPSGVSIIGSESGAAGWNRAAVTFTDQSSDQRWSMAMFGTASNEGEGSFGFGGGHLSTLGMNRLLITKRGDVGIHTNLVQPTCGMASCYAGRFLHVHSNSGGEVDASQMVLSSSAGANGSLVGGLAFAASASSSADRRVAAITGHVTNNPGSPVTGNMLFWTTNNGVINYNGILFQNGDFRISGNVNTVKVIQASDGRLKKNIRPLKEALKKILSLEGVSYFWKDKDLPGKRLGFIAQKVEKIFPELVRTQADGYKTMMYVNLVAPVIEAIKSLSVMNDQGSEQIAKLESENRMLRAYICSEDASANFCH
ncbi:tail fiber domain-containing protein [Peredibacter sp. HCB2-198]|uniref:tail fiber domain-containing protein n=1 Tax=Peredibacter sp. HCB2-198 TaxID=3383025 RepID=UPI0038B4E8AE